MSKANGHRWRFEHGLAESPVDSPEVRTLNHLGIVLCDVLEELAAVREKLQRLEMWEYVKSRERGDGQPPASGGTVDHHDTYNVGLGGVRFTG